MIKAGLRSLILFILPFVILSLVGFAILVQNKNNLIDGEPIYWQYFTYVNQLLHGYLGTTEYGEEYLLNSILTVFPPTLELCFIALFFAMLFGIPLGFIGAMSNNQGLTKLIKNLCLIGLSIPPFWLAPLLLYVATTHNWEIAAVGEFNLLYDIPYITGFSIIDMWFVEASYKLKIIQNVLQHLILPSLILMILPMMEIIRFVQDRTQYLLTQNYIQMALIRENYKFKVLYKYIFRRTFPALIMQIPRLFIVVITQCMLIEEIFSWPGIGHWLINAIRQQDYNSISAGVVSIGLFVLLLQNFIKLGVLVLDPFHKKGWYAS